MSQVEVDFPAPVGVTYAYLVDPHRRPEWQSSLRRVEDVRGSGEAGSTWTDVTSVGARPRMRVTEADPERSWTEAGEWRGVSAELRLDFHALDEAAGGGTRVVATVGLRTPSALAPLGVVLRRLAPLGVRSDLRRAAGRVRA